MVKYVLVVGMMVKMVRETSLTAYLEEKEKFFTQECKVLEFIKNNPNTYDREIAESLNMECSTVAARRNKLFREGLIIEGEKVKSKTGKKVQGWLRK